VVITLGHIKKVKLRRLNRIGGYTISVFSRPFRPTRPGHPSVRRWNEYWQWFRSLLGKKRVLRCSRPCYQDCWNTGLLYFIYLFIYYESRTKVHNNGI